MEKLMEFFKESSPSGKQFAEHYLTYLGRLLTGLDLESIEKIIQIFVAAGEQGKTIYFIGNGGSAATAAHFASDLSMNTKADGHKLIKAVSLVDNVATITAVSNDEGYENIFVSQLEVLLNPGDILVALSVSGNSPNIVKAVEYAGSNGAITIGCTGFDGGRLRELVDISLHVPTAPGEYGPVEDVFQILDHLIYSYLRLERFGKLEH